MADETGEAGEDGGGDGGDTEAPGVEVLSVIPSPANHLAITVTFETDEPTVGNVEVIDGEGLSWTTDSDEHGKLHAVEIIGLRAMTTFTMYVRARDDAGNLGTAELSHTPGPLPEDLPALAVSGRVPEGQPSWTFFSVFRWGDVGPDLDYGYVIAVDGLGRVVWYRRILEPTDVQKTPAGTLVMVAAGDQHIVELDLYGRELERWRVDEVDPATAAFHHEVWPKPDGTGFWTLGGELRTIDGYDDGMGGTTAYDVVGDTILELDRSGEILTEWSLFDALPMEDWLIQGEDFHARFWDRIFEIEQTKDWSHGNGLIFDPAQNVFILSARHLDWLIALDATTGALAWRMGEGGDFTLAEGSWFSHQHAPEIQPDGTLMVYDNGNFRDGAGTEPGQMPPTTRVVRYAYDPVTLEASEVWSWKADPPRYAQFVGDADGLANGHVLVTDGGLAEDPAGNLLDPANTKYALISQVDPDTGEVVFEVSVGGVDADESYTVYRAERMAGPY